MLYGCMCPHISKGTHYYSFVCYRNISLLRTQAVSSVADWSTIEESFYPHFPSISNPKVAAADRSAVLNLSSYIDSAAYSIRETTSFQRTYRMFRTLGLRQLVVVNKYNQVQGIITRVDLLTSRPVVQDPVKAKVVQTKAIATPMWGVE